MNCTGERCIMQAASVDPETCKAVEYCPQATPPIDKLFEINCPCLYDYAKREFDTQMLLLINVTYYLQKEHGLKLLEDEFMKSKISKTKEEIERLKRKAYKSCIHALRDYQENINE